MEELRLVAGALLTGLGALGGGVGIGTLTSKYIEAVARPVSYTHLTLPPKA